MTFALTTIVGFAASYGVCYILDSINAFIVMEEFVFDDYIIAIIALPLQLLFCFISPLIAKIYVKWHKFKNKYFIKNN